MPTDMTKFVNLSALDKLAAKVDEAIDNISTETSVVSGGLSYYIGTNPPENFNGLIFKTIN